MKTSWTKGLKPQEAEEITAGFNACGNVRKRLETLIQEKIRSKRKEIISDTNYSSPSWAYLQADAVGYERAMNEIVSLISNNSVEKE